MDRLASRMIQLSEDSTKTYEGATKACDKIKSDTMEYLSQYFLENSHIPSADDISTFIRSKSAGGYDPITKQFTERVVFVDTPTHFVFHVSIDVEGQMAMAKIRVEKEKKLDTSTATSPSSQVEDEANPVTNLRTRR